MKKVVLFLSLILFAATLNAQKCKEKDMPAGVMGAFNKAYPDVKKMYCGKESTNYQISFFEGNAPVSITYNGDGKRLITEKQIPVEDLPQGIIEYVQSNYPGEIYQEVAQITNEDGIISYDVQVKMIDLVFDANARYIGAFRCED